MVLCYDVFITVEEEMAMAGGHYDQSLYDEFVKVLDRLDTMKKETDQKIAGLNNEISDLKKENKKLQKENDLLKEDNTRLKNLLNHDSSNTSKPPSSDQKPGRAANNYNNRKKSEKKPGAQTGHKGTTLSKEKVEEKLASGKYLHEIETIGKVSERGYVVRYVIDLRVQPVIREIRIYKDADGKYPIPERYRSEVVYGPTVRALAVDLYSEGVMSNDRIAAFLNDASEGCLELSEGSVYGFCRKFSDLSGTEIEKLEEHLTNQPVVATDATTVSLNGKQSYIRNISDEKTVVYYGMEKKTKEALGEIPFFSSYAGTLLHDHETALYQYGTDHAECNVHILRYLKKNTEETGNQWSKELSDLLCEINRERKKQKEEGKSCFSEEKRQEYEKRYAACLEKGIEENHSTKHKYAKREEKTLLTRLEKYCENHLLFLKRFEVPFDNNMSERDLRKVKNRQKMAGGFRKEKGQKMYCRILSIVETLKRRKMNLMAHIKQIFIGTPAIF